MKGRYCLSFVPFFFALSLSAQFNPDSGPGVVPVRPVFVENRGQWNPQARYLARLGGMNVWITDHGMTYDFYRIERCAPSPRSSRVNEVVDSVIDADARV